MGRRNLSFNVIVLVLCGLLVSKSAGTEAEGDHNNGIELDVCQLIRYHFARDLLYGNGKYFSSLFCFFVFDI